MDSPVHGCHFKPSKRCILDSSEDKDEPQYIRTEEVGPLPGLPSKVSSTHYDYARRGSCLGSSPMDKCILVDITPAQADSQWQWEEDAQSCCSETSTPDFKRGKHQGVQQQLHPQQQVSPRDSETDRDASIRQKIKKECGFRCPNGLPAEQKRRLNIPS